MNYLYIIGGMIMLAYGVWQTITTAKVFLKGKQDWLGADIKILVGGYCSDNRRYINYCTAYLKLIMG